MLCSILLAARPKTLPAAIVPVWTGCMLAWKLTGAFHLPLALWTLLGAVSIQIATNFFNDAIDARKGADTGQRLGPKRVTASGLMAPRAVIAWGGCFVIFAFACGIPLYQARGWPILAIGIPSLFLTYGYTGGPVPLAYRGLGELFVILFFGLVAVTGTVFIQTATWPREALLLGLQIGLLSSVLISINNLRDRREDQSTGKRTLAVRLGETAARFLIGAELAIAAFAGILWLPFHLPWLLCASLPILLTATLLLKKIRCDAELNRCLAVGGLLLLIFAATLAAVISL